MPRVKLAVYKDDPDTSVQSRDSVTDRERNSLRITDEFHFCALFIHCRQVRARMLALRIVSMGWGQRDGTTVVSIGLLPVSFRTVGQVTWNWFKNTGLYNGCPSGTILTMP